MINSGREWDWIQELYYKELNDRSKNNRDSRKIISGEKKIFSYCSKLVPKLNPVLELLKPALR